MIGVVVYDGLGTVATVMGPLSGTGVGATVRFESLVQAASVMLAKTRKNAKRLMVHSLHIAL